MRERQATYSRLCLLIHVNKALGGIGSGHYSQFLITVFWILYRKEKTDLLM